SRRRHTRSLRDWSSDVCSSDRSEEHTSELQSRRDLVCRLLLDKSSDVCSDRKSTRLNSSNVEISYAVFCLKKKKGNAPETIYNLYRDMDALTTEVNYSSLKQLHDFCDLLFFFNDTGTPEIYPLSLPDALPI